MVVDAFVYHKHCKFHGCTITLTLQLKHNRRMVVKAGGGGLHHQLIAAGRSPHGRAHDLKRSAARRQPGLSKKREYI
jgi:hypothetical protein